MNAIAGVSSAESESLIELRKTARRLEAIRSQIKTITHCEYQMIGSGRYPKVGEVGFKKFRMEPIALSGLMRQTNMIECHITREGQKLLQLMLDASVS